MIIEKRNNFFGMVTKIGEIRIKASDNDKNFKRITIEMDYDSIIIIERFLKHTPELGYSNVEHYLEELLRIKANEISEQGKLRNGNKKMIKPGIKKKR